MSLHSPRSFVTSTPILAKSPAQAATPPATVAAMLGELVWLLAQSPNHKFFFVADLEWLVMPPILLNQFRVFRADGKPVGFALWASVAPEVEQRLSTGLARLQPSDWQSGPALWLVDVIAPFGHVDAMLEDLRQSVFAGKRFKFFRRDPDGKQSVVEMDGVAANGQAKAP